MPGSVNHCWPSLAHGFVGRIKDVTLARVDFTLHAGYQHVGAAHLHCAFERRYQIAVIILVSDWLACVLERPRHSVDDVRSVVAAMFHEFVERDGFDCHWLLSVFHICVPFDREAAGRGSFQRLASHSRHTSCLSGALLDISARPRFLMLNTIQTIHVVARGADWRVTRTHPAAQAVITVDGVLEMNNDALLVLEGFGCGVHVFAAVSDSTHLPIVRRKASSR